MLVLPWLLRMREISSGAVIKFVDVGNQASPQQVYFGLNTTVRICHVTRYRLKFWGFLLYVIALASLARGRTRSGA